MREPDGLREFVARTSPTLLRSAWLLTRDWHAAEDLVQTALLRAIPRWHQIERHDDPAVYVRTVMLRLYLSGRKRRWTSERPVAELPERITDDPMMSSDLRMALLGALDRLPRQQRAVLVLRYFDDLTAADTAQVLGCSVGTVKSHTARAMTALRLRPELLDLVTEVTA